MYNLASIEERITSIFLEFPELKTLQNKKEKDPASVLMSMAVREYYAN